MRIPKDCHSPDLREITKAQIAAAQDGLSGIVLTNSDARADYVALTERNNRILSKHGLSVEEHFESQEDGGLLITSVLFHKESGQYFKSCFPLPVNEFGIFPKKDSPSAFFFRRCLYEGLLGLACSNCAIEAELFGPKRKHKEISKPYDATSDVIEFEFTDHNGKKYKKKQDRRKFEKLFLGMTSEEEEQAVFKIPEYRRFSWSDIKLFLRCKRCFYNAKKLGVKLNNFDREAFGLEKVADCLLKKEFDQYRELKTKHPIMEKSIALRPLRHEKLNGWRVAWTPNDRFNIGGVQFYNGWENWLVYGGVDDIWLSDKKELIIVDYKSSTSGKIYPEYQKQVEFYSWILKKRNYNVSPVAYLLFYVPLTNRKSFDWRLDFVPDLKEVQLDDSWVQKTINEALECLNGESQPVSGFNWIKENSQKNGVDACRVCTYFDNLTEKIKK